ncbi:MAG TPA: protein kinase [Vicinamibacterales bacterium]|nr:protein kinase [Vicinamibacterales bacterium]
MPLTPGTRLGPYEIVAPIGAGGMGEVYSARDRRLDRSVAVKTLSASIAGSPDARQRFEREAKAISRLSHPHICALFDVGHEGDVEYLVMELLEGETLARRLTKGPLPVTQVLRYGREIADALGAAHRQGIVHRDLKPGNVMLTPTGVKLLDFGLAKTVNVGSPVDAADASTAAVPTSLTTDGSLLGTAPYMAPEQIQGHPADARSDIFALGAVLYEMATGKRAFTGATTAAIAGSILHEDPPSMSGSNVQVPAAFSRLVRTCLSKDPASRWQTAQDVALQLTGIEEDERQTTSSAVAAVQPRARTNWLPWVLAAAVVIVAGAAWLSFGRARETPVAAVELQIVPPGGFTYWYTSEGATFAVSPDGTRLAFVASQSRKNQIWIRSLAALDAKPIPGTDDAHAVFWSPDGLSIAFFAAGALKRLDLSSGIAVTLCQIRLGTVHQGTWGSNGTILFASVEGEAIRSISAAGGAVTDIVTPDRAKGEGRLVFPSYLPGGDRFLYLVRMSDGRGQLMMGEPGKPPHAVMAAESNATFVNPGYLVFAKEGTLVARRFELSTGAVSGGELPIADSVRYLLSTALASYSASPTGTIVYQPQRDSDHLAWFDRSGKELATIGTPGEIVDVRLASDHTALFSRSLPSTGTYDVWSFDLDRGLEQRVTPDNSATEIRPIPLKNGNELILAATFGGPPQVARFNLGTNEKTPLFALAPRLSQPDDISSDGLLAFDQRSARGNYEIWTVRLGSAEAPRRLNASTVTEGNLEFSPDGKTYVYGSFESGRFEAYIRSMAGGVRQPLTAGGVSRVHWNPNGREVLYLTPDGRLVAVPVRTAPGLELGKEETLAVLKGRPWLEFSVARDGRLLAIVRDLVAEEQPLTAKIGWRGGK